MLVTTATELPRLMACIGSRNMPAALPPDHDHEARDEGNAAHWLAKVIFDGGDAPPGSRAFNGYVITDDMREHVREYVKALDAGEMECDVSLSGVNWQINSRADHICFNPHHSRLTVDDFKYGWRLVEPDANWTLIAYAIGWCAKHNLAPAEIVLRIHQPRPYHPSGTLREWRVSYVDLMTYYAQISQRLGYPDDTLATGSQCAKCHALPTCPAARAASMNAIDATGVAFSDALPDHVLAFEYETLKMAKATIENRYEALEELMTHKIQGGTVMPGYALKTRYAQRRWKPGIDAATLSLAAGRDVSKPGIVTPAEAERRGVNPAAITALTERPSIGTKLERIDADKEARKVFGNG